MIDYPALAYGLALHVLSLWIIADAVAEMHKGECKLIGLLNRFIQLLQPKIVKAQENVNASDFFRGELSSLLYLEHCMLCIVAWLNQKMKIKE
jgi:hypothetical protein